MSRSSLSFACAAVLALAVCGCSWGRFDDVVEDSPVVLLKQPSKLRAGFGGTLAESSFAGHAQLLVGGGPAVGGAGVFDLGSEDNPTLDAKDTGHCNGGDDPCYLSSSPVGLSTAKTSDGMERNFCFVNGSGQIANDYGLIERCADHVEFVLAVPKDVEDYIKFLISADQPEALAVNADHSDAQAVVAASTTKRLAWFYAPLSLQPVVLPLPKEAQEETYGATVAAAAVGEARVFAVAAPKSGNVRLFKSLDGKSASYIGCLGSLPGLGRAMTSGRISAGDQDEELVISDNNGVHVFDASVLLSLPETTSTDCSFASLPSKGLYVSVTCGSTKNVSDCGVSDFGASVAVGDLDGDGDGELIVGAPGMTTRGEKQAGALVVYDVESPGDATFASVEFISSAESEDAMGSLVQAPRIKDRNIIAATAPGHGKAALFYCPSFLPPSLRGARCK